MSFDCSGKLSKRDEAPRAKRPPIANNDEDKDSPSHPNQLSMMSDSCGTADFIKRCKEELRKRLLVDSKMNTLKGVKVVLENFIILTILTSAILKMNIQSFVYFVLVVII